MINIKKDGNIIIKSINKYGISDSFSEWFTYQLEKFMMKKCYNCNNRIIHYADIFYNLLRLREKRLWDLYYTSGLTVVEAMELYEKIFKMMKIVKKIWLDDKIKFVCCSCYDKINERNIYI